MKHLFSGSFLLQLYNLDKLFIISKKFLAGTLLLQEPDL